jgi:hypothetical protein
MCEIIAQFGAESGVIIQFPEIPSQNQRIDYAINSYLVTQQLLISLVPA